MLNRLTPRLILSHLLVIAIAMTLLGFLLLSLVQGYFEQAVATASWSRRGSSRARPHRIPAPQPEQRRPGAAAARIQCRTAAGAEPRARRNRPLRSGQRHPADHLAARHPCAAHRCCRDRCGRQPARRQPGRKPSGCRTGWGGAGRTRATGSARGQMFVAAPLARRLNARRSLPQPTAGRPRSGYVGFAGQTGRLGTDHAGPLRARRPGAVAAIARPVRELTAAADRLAGGDFDYPLHTTSPEELADLARSFGSMRDASAHATGPHRTGHERQPRAAHAADCDQGADRDAP